MAASIALTKSITMTDAGTTKLVLTAAGTNISSKVFAIEVYPASGDQTAPEYRFSHVCSPMELAEFPEDSPGGSCYFRISSITMIFDIAVMAHKVVETVTADVAFLVSEYNKLNSQTASVSVQTITG